MIIKRKLAQGELLLALALWGVALSGAVRGNLAVLQWLYFFAWYPLILFLDGLLYRLRGDSWLLNRPRDLLRLLFWSVSIWLVFEAFNLVLHNWGYVGVVRPFWVRWPGYALAFATVLPGILLAAEVLLALGAWRRKRGRPVKLAWDWEPLALLLGLALLVLPLICPRYCFALVWGGCFFLLDPFVSLLGGRSLIAAWLAGERREPYCLLAAGLGCGLWWESWNFFSTAKWVYTLPVLGFGKIFEMPLLGYLGFPPFALECAVMYNFMKALDERLLVTPRRCRYAVVIQLAFWLIMFAALDKWTVIAFQ